VDDPHLLDSSEAAAEDARRDNLGTIGLRLTPTKIVAKQKMSQDKPPEVTDEIIRQMEGNGPYLSTARAREMRLANGGGIFGEKVEPGS